jgi:hypothetical protein
MTYSSFPGLTSAIRGQHVLIGVHGFNVNQAAAIDHFQEWSNLLELGDSSVFVGGLWPGDSSWLGALEYPFAAKSAMLSGNAFAAFLNSNFTQVASLSFVSHSLGARVALQIIQQLSSSFNVRRLILMAPAVDDDCLTGEFVTAARRAGNISILASQCDDVLKLAFPLGNPISGIFAEGHPFWKGALGREGPQQLPNPDNIHAGWMLPNPWNVGHGDYLPAAPPHPPTLHPTPYALPVAFPASNAGAPAAGTPAGFDVNGQWVDWISAWTAAISSLRFQ